MWVLIDNYDSFTHILHHYLLQTGNECIVYRNDALTLQELIDLKPSRLIISPGPETPLQAGISLKAIAHFYNKIPVLGICLGHQAIGMHFGAKLIHAPEPVHGKIHSISHTGTSVFKNLPSPMSVMRYHSLSLKNEESFLKITATTSDGTIMAIEHPDYPCVGLQFHPESIGTIHGQQMLNNWAGMYS